jgi:hypothetical protein
MKCTSKLFLLELNLSNLKYTHCTELAASFSSYKQNRNKGDSDSAVKISHRLKVYKFVTNNYITDSVFSSQ